MSLKKSDLIKILVDEYGYEKEDLKFDAQGKPYTNAKLQSLIDAEKEDAEVLKSKSQRIVREKNKKINDSDLIPVMNGLMGGLYYHSERTNRAWEFKDFGQEDNIEYGELLTLRNRAPRMLTEGMLIVLDEEVQKEFGLVDLYEHILTKENIDLVFEKPFDEIVKLIDAMPKGTQKTFVDKAQEKFTEGSLDSMKLIKYIEQKFGFSLEDSAPLESIVSSAPTVQMGLKKAIIVEKR
uniref:Carrier domain-containing protein n=1 Tax=Bacillus phage KoopaTroopa TaxID=3234046 RepID=A0AB39C701_9CAUD